MKCARCSRPILNASAWAGGQPFGPTCAQILELVLLGAPADKRAPTADFVPRHRSAWVDEGQQELFEGFDMSRKKCIRKHWNASAGFDAVAHAIAGACITNKASLDALQLRELSAVESITHGRGTLQDWRDLADVVNLCETAARMGIGPEALPACIKAQDSLIQAAKRYEDTSKIGLSGDGITALRDVIEYHHLQRQSVARSVYEEIIRNTVNRIRAKGPEVIEL